MSTPISDPVLARASRGGVEVTLVKGPDPDAKGDFFTVMMTGPFRYEVGILLHGWLKTIVYFYDEAKAMTAFCDLSEAMKQGGIFTSDESRFIAVRSAAGHVGGDITEQR